MTWPFLSWTWTVRDDYVYIWSVYMFMAFTTLKTRLLDTKNPLCKCLPFWFFSLLNHKLRLTDKQTSTATFVCECACTPVSCVQTTLRVINPPKRSGSEAEKIALHTIYHTRVSRHSQRWNKYNLQCTHNNDFINVSIFDRPKMRKPNYQSVKMK